MEAGGPGPAGRGGGAGEESIPWDRFEAVAVGAAVNAAAAEAVSALREAGIRSVLLKGASFERWLYGPDEPRMYGDVDLLVDARDREQAEGVLERLGYRPRSAELSPTHTDHAWLWLRASDHMHLDLHRSLLGVGAEVNAWEILAAETEVMEVGGTDVEVLAVPARAMHVALHAAVHADDPAKPMLDLARAVEREPQATWEKAAELARRLDAEGRFAAGLRMAPAGEALAAQLQLTTERSVETAMFTSAVPYSSWTVNRLANTPGVGPKLRIAARRVFPEPDFMRAWYPIAGRGPLGLALSYLRRLVWLAGATGPAVIAWARARRAARHGG
jgi:hypothetical protein